MMPPGCVIIVGRARANHTAAHPGEQEKSRKALNVNYLAAFGGLWYPPRRLGRDLTAYSQWLTAL